MKRMDFSRLIKMDVGMGRVSVWFQMCIAFIFYKGTNNANINYQLVFNPTEMTFVGAATWCEMKGGSMVTLDSLSSIYMVQHYKANDWNTSWSQHVWTGLYSFAAFSGYWHGTCSSLSFTFYDTGQIYAPMTPCTYMANSDLKWHYDLCTNSHFVVCQVPHGNCAFDGNDNKIDNALSSTIQITAATLTDCQDACQTYIDGDNQCWAVKYQASATKCDLYASVDPLRYFTDVKNRNQNYFYSSRECYSATILTEPEPTSSINVTNVVDNCEPTTLGGASTEKSTLGDTTTEKSTLDVTTTVQQTLQETQSTLVNPFSTQSTVTRMPYSSTGAMTTTGQFSSEMSTELTTTTGQTSYQSSTKSQGTTSYWPSDVSTEVITTTVQTECSFVCPCDFLTQNITTEMLQAKIEELKTLLTVEKTKTSAYIRKRTSAKDSRPSSQAIGALGIVIIAVTVGFMVVMDLMTLVQFFQRKRIYRRIIRRFRRHTQYANKVEK